MPSLHLLRTLFQKFRQHREEPKSVLPHEVHLPPSLPNEVILPSLILEYLDPATLISASSVCRLWRSIIRPKIFKELRVRVSGTKNGVEYFCDFLDATPDTSKLILSLHLTGRGSYCPDLIPFSWNELLAALSRLPSVRSLRLSYLLWVPRVEVPADPTLPTSISSLEYLEISDDFICDEVGAIISLFPGLHTLDLSSTLDYTIVTKEWLSKIQSTSIHTVKLSRPSRAATEFITMFSLRRPIRSVDFNDTTKPEDLNAFLRETGKQLTHIGFGLDENVSHFYRYSAPTTPPWHDLQLSLCTSLESLRVIIILTSGWTNLRFEHHWNSLISIIGQIPSTANTFIVRIKLPNGCNLTTELMNLGWEDLQDNILGIPTLVTVVIEIFDSFKPQDFEALMDYRKTLLRGKLSRLQAQRRLLLDFQVAA